MSWTFEHPWFLLGLLLVPAALWMHLRARPPSLQVSDLRTALQIQPTLRVRLRWLPEALRALALVVLVVALARPQQIDQEVISGEGIDIMIAFDMSGSMNAVDMNDADIRKIQSEGKEPDNRFEAARKILKDFIRGRKTDRIGLVVFGAEAYLRFPPTLDYVRLLNAIDALVLDDGERTSDAQDRCSNNCTIQGSGTAIGDALNRAFLRLEKSKARSKMLILVTDGKQEGGKMEPLVVPKYIASLPEKDRVRVFTFLIGGGKETRTVAKDPFTRRPLTDRFGRMVYRRPDRPAPIDPELLRQIADMTGAKAYDSYDAKKFADDFKDLERSTFSVKVHTNRRELFYGWLLGGLALLGLELLLRRTWLRTFP